MYHMALSLRNVAEHSRGLRTLRELVGHGRERDAWLVSERRAGPLPEMISVWLEAPLTVGAVTVILRTSDVYVIGVANDHAAFYFKDTPPGRLIANQVLLGFTGHYKDLGAYVSLGRLDKGRFDAAVARWTSATKISNVIKSAKGQEQSPEARHLLALILVTAESARFLSIGLTVANALDGGPDSPLTLADIDQRVHDWEKQSARAFPMEVAVPIGGRTVG
jgi:hypothetical protein